MIYAFITEFTNEAARLERNLDASDEFMRRKPKWQESLESLKRYVDILAPELLAVWDVTEESVPVSQTAVPHDKVLNWLGMAGERNIVEAQEEPGFSLTPINTQELMMNASQQPEVIDIAEDIPPEAYFPPVVVKTGKKSQSKKRTYVAGF